MILKCKKKRDEAMNPTISLAEGFSFTDNIAWVEIKDNKLIGKWKDEEEQFEDDLNWFDVVYLLNDKGQTIERLV